MQRQPNEKQFFRYVLPSMLAMLLTGFYAIIDGFFVGRAVGDAGLAAINLAWPIAAFLLAAGTGIGAGGSVLMSTRLGENDPEGSRKAYGNTIFTLLFFSAIITVVLFLAYRPILDFLGATGTLFSYSAEYTQVIVLGSAFQIFGTGLVPLLRNKGKTISAMAAMVAGLLTNICLDALFIMGFGWGLFGAAFATVIAQAIVAVISLILLFSRPEDRIRVKELRPHGKTIARLAKIGLSPFGMSFAPSLVIILANWQCLAYGGDVAVAAFSVLMYFYTSAQLLMQGVGEGAQPLFSYFNGAGDRKTVHILLRRALIMVLLLSAALCVTGILFRDTIPVIFGTSPEASTLVSSALVIVSLAFPLTGAARLSSSFFYAMQKTRYSALIIYTDPLALTPLFLFLLPLAFGLTGIWLSIPAAQGALIILTALLFRSYFSKCRRDAITKTNGGLSYEQQ